MIDSNSFRRFAFVGAAALALVLSGCSASGAAPADETATATADALPSTPAPSAPTADPTPTAAAAPEPAPPAPEPAAPTWESIDGTWCSSAFPTDCLVIAGQTDTTWGLPISFVSEQAGCFLGLEEGANVLFCPAGVPTPGAELSPGTGEPGRDNPAFDRLWVYNGQGPDTLFREDDLTAATA
jgi:hypothetical protein